MPELPFEPPLPWLWSCHHCHTRYPLGTTRRCLHDGHYFCGGTTVSPLTGKTVKRHRACGSEFDYNGWHEVVEWKGSLAGRRHNGRPARTSCETSCEYPSACHQNRRKGSNVAVVEPRKEAQADRRVYETFLDPIFFQVDHAGSPKARRVVQDKRNSQHPHPQVSDIAAKATDSKPHTSSLEPSFPGPAVTDAHVMHGADNEEDDHRDSDTDLSVFPSFRRLEADLLPIKGSPTTTTTTTTLDSIVTYPDPLDLQSSVEPWPAPTRVQDDSRVRFVAGGKEDDDGREPHEREWSAVENTTEDGWEDGGDFVRFIDVTDEDDDDDDGDQDEVMTTEDEFMEVDLEDDDAARYDDDDVEMMQDRPDSALLLPVLRRY